MLKSIVALSLALAATACAAPSASSVASHGHKPSIVLSDAAALAGSYTENKAERQEWNQNAPVTGSLELVLKNGTNGGTYTNVDDQGKETTGAWSVTRSGALNIGDGQFGYEIASQTLTVIGDHDESRSVLVRN